jgi:hypothetical protein
MSTLEFLASWQVSITMEILRRFRQGFKEKHNPNASAARDSLLVVRSKTTSLAPSKVRGLAGGPQVRKTVRKIARKMKLEEDRDSWNQENRYHF